MVIRKKDGVLRITFIDPSRPTDVPYLLIEPKQCWTSTFNAWGKKTDAPIVEIGTKSYRVTLEEIR